MSSKKAIVIAVVVVVVSGFLLVAGFFGLAFISVKGVWSREPTAAEKELLIHVSRLEAYGRTAPSPSSAESYRAQWNLDGSFTLEYEYDSDKDPEIEEFLFMTSEAEVNRGVREAKESYTLTIGAYKVGVKLVNGRLIQPSNESLALGDDSYSALIRQDGKPIGNIAVVRQGKAVHSLLI